MRSRPGHSDGLTDVISRLRRAGRGGEVYRVLGGIVGGHVRGEAAVVSAMTASVRGRSLRDDHALSGLLQEVFCVIDHHLEPRPGCW